MDSQSYINGGVQAERITEFQITYPLAFGIETNQFIDIQDIVYDTFYTGANEMVYTILLEYTYSNFSVVNVQQEYLTLQVYDKNGLGNSVGSIYTLNTYPNVWHGVENVVGGYTFRTDLHANDGWKNVVQPQIGVNQVQGTIFYDSVNDVITYTVVDLTPEQIEANIASTSEANKEQIVRQKIETIVVTELQASNDPAEQIANLDAFPFWAIDTVYTLPFTVKFIHEGEVKLYRVEQPHTSQFTPPEVPALYTRIAAPGQVLPWVQPTGAQDAYPLGGVVNHNGFNWTSLVPANVWEPSLSVPTLWQQGGVIGTPISVTPPTQLNIAGVHFVGGLIGVAGVVHSNAINALATATIAAASNRWDAMPIIPSRNVTVEKFSVEVTTAVASSLCRLELYESGANGSPAILIANSANLDCATLGNKEWTPTTPIQLKRNVQYWIAVHTNSTQTLRANAVGSVHPVAVLDAAGTNRVASCLRATVAFATTPNPAPSATATNTSTPLIKFKLI